MDYTYIIRGRSWLVGTEKRSIGELIPEAANWPNLRVYVDNKWIEKIPVDDPEVQAAMERATAPESSQPKVQLEVKSDVIELAGLDSFAGAVSKEGQRRFDAQKRAQAVSVNPV